METSRISKKRGSTIKACLRCHRRKQRCVGYPACSNCAAANVPCSRTSTPSMRRLAGLSKEELLKRVEELEAQSSTRAIGAGTSPGSPRAGQEDGSFVDDWEQAMGSGQEQPETEEMPESICDDNAASPALRTPQEAGNLFSDTCKRPERETYHSEDIWNITTELRQQILTTYLESMHRRVPFCDYTEVLHTSEGVNRRDTAPPTDPARIKLIRLYMCCAIGATVMQLTGESTGLHPEMYFSRALQLRDSMRKPNLVEQTEITLWIVLYKLRTCFSSEVWYLVGSALRMAIDADLHREHHYKDLDSGTAELHRCLFWAVYVIERNICWSLKRPFSLADHDIDTRLPTPTTHSTFLDGLADRDHGPPESLTGPRRPLDTRIFISTIKLAQVKSQIYRQIHRVDQSCVVRDQIPPLLDRLHQFEASLPQCSPPDYEFLQLHVKNGIRVLIEPLLSTLDRSDYLIKTCLEASGGVCQLFKSLRLKRCLGYSFTMINSVFVAGMTICYIVSKDPSLWTPAMANDFRVCSSSLYAAAERNGSIRKYCDTLDAIIEAVSEYVEQVTSPLASHAGPRIQESVIYSPAENKSPRNAFDKLGQALQELKFEFPSHSYPLYRLEDDSSLGVCGSEYVHSSSVPWDSIGMFGEVDMSSLQYLFTDSQAI